MISTTLAELSKKPIPSDLMEAIPAQLERVVGSAIFKRSRRLRHFLRFAVEQTLQGRQDVLKEYSIGLEVFGKPETFDPRLDSIVRVEARRLRLMVDRYYATEGRNDGIRISFKPGGYVPTFHYRSPSDDPWGVDQGTEITLIGGDCSEIRQIVGELERLQQMNGEETHSSGDHHANGHARLGIIVSGGAKGQEAVESLKRQIPIPCEYFSSPLTEDLLELLVAADPEYFFVNPVKRQEIDAVADLVRAAQELRSARGRPAIKPIF